ncbi:anti-CBASS protein Acb1 family protein, partial [Staphylococcus aureus]
RIAENGWGLSVLEPLWDRLIAFDSASVGAGQLVYKAHLRTYSVDGLRNIIAAGGDALKGLMSQIEFTRLSQSNEGMTVIDAADKLQADT